MNRWKMTMVAARAALGEKVVVISSNTRTRWSAWMNAFPSSTIAAWNTVP